MNTVAYLHIGAFLTTLALTLLLTALAIRFAARVGYVDRPGGHKSHRAPVPYGGGVAIFASAWLVMIAAFAATVLISPDWVAARFGETMRDYQGGLRGQALELAAILLGGAMLHVLGLYDDVRPQGPWVKLTVMVLVGALVSGVGGVRVLDMAGGIWATVITTAWFVVIINAFNFLDNMDGLSAGVAAICTVALALCGLLAGQVFVPALGCIFLGALCGFLVFNLPPARIFMGDAGSLVIGYMLAILSTLTTYYESGGDRPAYALMMPLVVLAVPLYDFVSVVGIRLLEGRNPMAGDQRHFSHRLVEHGLSRRFAVFTIYLATGATSLAATLLPGADLRRTATVVLVVFLVLLIIAILETPPRKAA
ncbi:MAG: MraY family glycosyltransferase [Phycisphaerae bacterium]